MTQQSLVTDSPSTKNKKTSKVHYGCASTNPRRRPGPGNNSGMRKETRDSEISDLTCDMCQNTEYEYGKRRRKREDAEADPSR
jgi:hypothetical protein